MRNQQHPPGTRKKVLIWMVALFVLLGLVVGWAVDRATNRGDAPMGKAASGNTVLSDIAGIFDEQLSGFQVSYTPAFADYLAAVRPGALNSEAWPEADYALFHVPRTYESDAKAVGIVVWVGELGTATGRAMLCAEVGVDRAGARIHLQETRCPDNVPSEPGQTDAPQERAAVLDLPVKIRSSLVTGQPAKRGMTMAGVLPANPARAGGQCSANELDATFDSGNAAGNTDDYILRVQNVSAEPCELSEATGIEINQGTEILRPPWTQRSSTVTLQPWESAASAISYRPDDISSEHQIITLHLPDGDVIVGAPAGPSGRVLAVSKSTQINATPWEVVGYGVGVGTWENGYAFVHIAPPCQSQQLAVTTPRPEGSSSEQDEAEELPYRLLNISTGTCRIDAGSFAGLDTVPPLDVAAAVVLQPGTAVDLGITGGAPNLFDILVVDGVQVSTSVR
ncbi:DUF4232 domain-containing protein [Arthrobacter alpinus]|nr:DUF4232 domain-containing protein [Arthrobacter alpinus]